MVLDTLGIRAPSLTVVMVEFANYLSFIRDNDFSPVVIECADDFSFYPAARGVVPNGPETVVYRQCGQDTAVRMRDP